jgi:hypothetical protein
MQYLLRNTVIAILLLAPNSLWAQVRTHIFPEFVDGTTSDGSFYKTTIIIVPPYNTDKPACTLTTNGLSVTFESGEPRGNSFNFTVPASGWLIARTNASQTLTSGYATLTCDLLVYAQALITLYSANGTKISEAGVSSTEYQSFVYKLIIDYRDSGRLGLAIANNSDVEHTYDVRLIGSTGIRTASFTVSARRNKAIFADELIGIPIGTVGIVTVQSRDRSDFSIIGMRFTGGAFATIPAVFSYDTLN